MTEYQEGLLVVVCITILATVIVGTIMTNWENIEDWWRK